MPNNISIHALREEGDTWTPSAYTGTRSFLSTPSARRATVQHLAICKDFIKFLSTPSARRATVCLNIGRAEQIISIHALREEGDCP